MDPLRREMQRTVSQGRQATVNVQRLSRGAMALNRRATAANALGNVREVQAGRLQQLFNMLYDRFSYVRKEVDTLRRIIAIKARQLRGKGAELRQLSGELVAIRRRILGLTRSSRILEQIEQRSAERSEIMRTMAVNRGANRKFAISQLPRRMRRR